MDFWEMLFLISQKESFQKKVRIFHTTFELQLYKVPEPLIRAVKTSNDFFNNGTFSHRPGLTHPNVP